MFRYFGFGSNMNIISLRAKGVEPIASRRAVLHGWRLCFNVQHFFRHEGGVGNIEPCRKAGSRVLGVLYDCPDEALVSLDAVEAYGYGYDRIDVAVQTDQGQVQALAYVGMPEFIDDHCLPSQRYLNILVAGARAAGLEPDYVRDLQAHPVHQPEDCPPFVPPQGDFPLFDANSLARYPFYTGLYGAVFDMSEARPLHNYLKRFFGGRDMTLFHLKRLDTSDGKESMEDIKRRRLNEAQLRYLKGYLSEYAKEYRYVGRFSYDNHDQG